MLCGTDQDGISLLLLPVVLPVCNPAVPPLVSPAYSFPQGSQQKPVVVSFRGEEAMVSRLNQSLGKCATAPETPFFSKLNPGPAIPFGRDIEALEWPCTEKERMLVSLVVSLVNC